MAQKKRRGPKHRGVVLMKPNEATRAGWRARWKDPDTGEVTTASLLKLDASLTTEEKRRDWAVRKSKELAERRAKIGAENTAAADCDWGLSFQGAAERAPVPCNTRACYGACMSISATHVLTIEQYPTLGTVAEAAAVLRTSRPTLLRLIARGRLRPAKHADGGSSRLLISRRELARYIAELEGL